MFTGMTKSEPHTTAQADELAAWRRVTAELKERGIDVSQKRQNGALTKAIKDWGHALAALLKEME